MPLSNAKELKQIFHLTALENMPSIVEHGLMPREVLIGKRVDFSDIADPSIIMERNKGDLDRYIPFHFHPYTAFDLAVRNKHSDKAFVYIAIKRDFARYAGFKVIPAHPLSSSGTVTLYPYDEGFKMIDWEEVSQTGSGTSYRKQAKMAECLTDKIIPATLFQNVYVHDAETKQYIEMLFREAGITEQPPFVNIMSEWV